MNASIANAPKMMLKIEMTFGVTPRPARKTAARRAQAELRLLSGRRSAACPIIWNLPRDAATATIGGMAADDKLVPVDVLDTPYVVRVGAGLLDRIGQTLRPMTKSTRVGLVTDSNVGPLYAERVTASLKTAGFEVTLVTLPAGEAHKTLPGLMPVFDAMLAARAERSTPLIALGGGVVGDMTGFAAATLLRGVPFVQVPTTLLSMVDASVGGKTGVDHPAGKNLIGAFHQPLTVIIDPDALKTLPRREFRSGLAECVKHDIIRDSFAFAEMERDIDFILTLDPHRLADLIAHNVAIKAQVVQNDPFENGERAHLNFGHTFGHAIETISKFDYAHGEAVALGMIAASRAAVEIGILKDSHADKIKKLLDRVGLPTGRMTLDVDAIYDAMYSDKKVKAGKLRLVLPDRIGHVVIRDDVPTTVVKDALRSLTK
ncbi:MAG: 3-dehydroquinate synthase [Tepidisphaeraceae bacterium]